VARGLVRSKTVGLCRRWFSADNPLRIFMGRRQSSHRMGRESASLGSCMSVSVGRSQFTSEASDFLKHAHSPRKGICFRFGVSFLKREIGDRVICFAGYRPEKAGPLRIPAMGAATITSAWENRTGSCRANSHPLSFPQRILAIRENR